jgi:biotin synthase
MALSREEARAVLEAPSAEVPAMVSAAYRVRRRDFGDRVRLNYLLNAKSGI